MKPGKARGDIEQFLTHSQLTPTTFKMVEPRGESEVRARDDRPASPVAFMELDCYSDIPAALQTGAQTPTLGLREAAADAELWALLKALPTKADIESLIGHIESQHRKEMKAVRGEIKSLTTRLSVGETSVAELERRVSDLEHLQEARGFRGSKQGI